MLAAYLARVSDNVTSYELNEKHAAIAKKNCDFLWVKVKIKQKEIYQCIDEKNVDVITLDLQYPEKVLQHTHKSLKIGGYLVIFSPHISQVQEVIKQVTEKFLHLKTIELIERKWIVEDLRLRPEHMGLLHTGFLTFLRKVE
jgi:tRNA A58 N-methylase Trm61